MSKVAARIEKVKTGKEAGGRERHNRRKGNCKSSDKDREHLNEYKGVEGIASHINALEKQINANLKAQGKRALRKDAIKLIEVIVTSDSEFFKKYDYKDYFRDSDEFLEQFWGQDNIIGEYAHLDEGTPHKHYFVTPIRDGKFNYSSFINGKDDLSQFQEHLYNFMVGKGYELEERQKAEVTKKKHEKTRDWAKRVSKAEEMVALMDQDKVMDYAVKGVLAEQEDKILYDRLEELTEANNELRDKANNLQMDNIELDEKYQGLKLGALKGANGNQKMVENMENWGVHQIRIQKAKELEAQEHNIDLEQ